MRCDQYYGLNKWATSFARATQEVLEVGKRVFADGSSEEFERKLDVPLARIEVIEAIEGAFDPKVAELHRYTMPNGEVYEEYVQANPWSSGPCYFIALKRDNGQVIKQSLWRREQINRC